MDPNTKLILDQLKTVQADLAGRIDAVEHSIGARVGSLEEAAKVFDEWKPQMDTSVAELRFELTALRQTDDKVDAMHDEMTGLRKSVSHLRLGGRTGCAHGHAPTAPGVCRDDSRGLDPIPPERAPRGIKPPGI